MVLMSTNIFLAIGFCVLSSCASWEPVSKVVNLSFSRVRVEYYVNENTFKERLQLYFIKNQRSSKYWDLNIFLMDACFLRVPRAGSATRFPVFDSYYINDVKLYLPNIVATARRVLRMGMEETASWCRG
jgi:hypothetical protein